MNGVKFHYAVYSRLPGSSTHVDLEAHTTNRTAADRLITGLRLIRSSWEYRIVALTGRGKSTDWS